MLNEKEIQRLRGLTNFPAIVGYLRDELDWPVEADNIEEIEGIAFNYEPDELGVDAKHAVKINRIRQLRNLAEQQPWGIFYVEFESKRLPVMVLRRILQALVRANDRRRAWDLADLLFICVQGEPGQRGVAFAHFLKAAADRSEELRTFSWDSREAHFHYLVNLNLQQLRWPRDERNQASWRTQWRAAFSTRHLETIRTAERMASAMAEHARTIRELVEDLYAVEAATGPLHALLDRFRIDLLHDLTPDSFADMIAQTITYGLFAAAEQSNDLNYSHIVEAIPKTNPFLKELLAALINEGQIDLAELGVDRLVELLREANIAQITHDFMRQSGSGQEDPVVHFYEQFLHEYDRKQRVERGVFYTPDPVVSYIVRSVDTLLKTEFGLEDGLASDVVNPETGEHLVQILDPATGTGTFLAHIIDLIAQRKGASNTPAWNDYVSQHLLPRLNGFELMMASYTIAHMKLGLKLQQTGYNFASEERLHVYLTNALEKATEIKETLALTGFLSKEANEAAQVKRRKPIMVVLGNPPYSNFGQLNQNDWILSLLEDYKKQLEEKKINLNDDYIKFIRFGQWRIDENGQGILAFVTNNSFLDGITHRRMRHSLLQSFTTIYILNLHGNSLRQETTPNGLKDENVFDIRVGVSLCLFVKVDTPRIRRTIHYADLWGERNHKYNLLLGQDISSQQDPYWVEIEPDEEYCLFIPKSFENQNEYRNFWGVEEIFQLHQNGLKTDRDNLFFDYDYDSLFNRIKDFYSETGMSPDFIQKYSVEDSSSYKLLSRRKSTQFQAANITKCIYRHFDTRWLYYNPNLTSRPAWDVMRHMLSKKNLALICLRQTRRNEIGTFFVGSGLINKDAVSLFDINTVFPLYQYSEINYKTLFDLSDNLSDHKDYRSNFYPAFIKEIEQKLTLKFLDNDRGDLVNNFGPDDLFHYIYSILYCPTYRNRYSEVLKRGFPRIPLIDDPMLFLKLVQKGADLVALHLLQEEYAAASWNLDKEASPFADPGVRFVPGLDGTTVGKFGHNNYEAGKVYLDSSKSGSYFDGIPEEVWKFQIGGYQVCHKWLYDRRAVNNQPGRTLSEDDLLHYMYIVASLRETIVLMNEIDNIIESHGGWPLRGSQPAKEKVDEEEINAMQTTLPLEAEDQEEPATELTAQLVDKKLSEESGVEYEGDDSPSFEENGVQPFDPTLIRIETRTVTIDGMIKRIANDEINLHPDFQRMGGIWNDVVQSRLIESLLIRIPLPAFYMDATDDDKWLVIDGLQRLTTLKRFVMEKSLKLQKLEFWGNEYNGKTFDGLPRSLQRRIEETQLTLYLVQKGTPHKVKFNIFKRINTGGVPLSGQEIRHALNLGYSTELVEELAKSHEFQRATDGSVSPMRMVDRECVLRFLAFKLKDPSDYSSRDDLDSFLNDRMQEINEQGKQRPAFLDELRASFKRAMNTAHDLFGNRAFRKIDKRTNRRSPISKALFEAWSVNLDKLSDEEIKLLVRRKAQLEKKFLTLLDDPEFGIAISYSTGDARRVKLRFGQVERIIRETLNA